MSNDEVVERLDTLIAIMRLAHGDQIDAAREAIREDPVNAAVLDSAADWTPAGELKGAAMKKSRQSKPTVERRIAALVDQGVLDKRGAGGHVSYRASGLI